MNDGDSRANVKPATRTVPAASSEEHSRGPRPPGLRIPVSQSGSPSIRSTLEIFKVALRLGLTSFGGPIAHLAYFRNEYVEQRQWLDDETYADLVALCQFLPGPASSQVGMAVGMMRGGVWGGVASWIGFTIPSALALTVFALILSNYNIAETGWMHGLLIVAVAIVADAVWGMASNLTPDRARASIAVVTAITSVLVPSAAIQVVLIIVAGVIGWLLLPKAPMNEAPRPLLPAGRRGAIVSLVAFALLLALLPIARQLFSHEWLALTDSLYRVGSLVFGGGHVVLPLLSAEMIAPGWVTDTEFLAGYGAAQAVPGPLFTFAAYLGATMGGPWMALVAVIAIFLPSFLIVTAALPFWNVIRVQPSFRSALNGVNAAVVGILLAALYDPIWMKAIKAPRDFSLALAAFALLRLWRTPAWAVVVFSAAAGSLLARFM